MKKLFPHLFVIAALFCLIALGTWQVQRRTEKQQMLNRIEANISTNTTSFKNIAEDEFKKMTLTGKYLYDKEFLLLNKPFNGKPGQHVMTPFQNTKGDVIIVDRGWVQTDKDYGKPAGQIKITTIIRAGQRLNSMAKLVILENNPQKQAWFWLDLPKIYESLGLPQKDYYLDLTTDEKLSSYPYALSGKIEVYNEHLIYIITWYSLAAVLLLVYYFRFWKK